MPLTFAFAFDVAVVAVFQPSAERTVSPKEKRISAPSQCFTEKDTTAQCYRSELKSSQGKCNNQGKEMENQSENQWLKARVAYLQGLKSRTDQQELMIILAEKIDRTLQDDKKLAVLVRAEKANVRAAKARQEAANLINAERKAMAEAERKARDHEMYQAAGLLSLAGLVDKKTGKPTVDRGQLLGALLGLSKVPSEDPRRGEWKRAGDALLNQEQM